MRTASRCGRDKQGQGWGVGTGIGMSRRAFLATVGAGLAGWGALKPRVAEALVKRLTVAYMPHPIHLQFLPFFPMIPFAVIRLFATVASTISPENQDRFSTTATSRPGNFPFRSWSTVADCSHRRS